MSSWQAWTVKLHVWSFPWCCGCLCSAENTVCTVSSHCKCCKVQFEINQISYLILAQWYVRISKKRQTVIPSQMPPPLHNKISRITWSHQHSAKLGRRCMKNNCTERLHLCIIVCSSRDSTHHWFQLRLPLTSFKLAIWKHASNKTVNSSSLLTYSVINYN